jgi:hypothetical protein
MVSEPKDFISTAALSANSSRVRICIFVSDEVIQSKFNIHGGFGYLMILVNHMIGSKNSIFPHN